MKPDEIAFNDFPGAVSVPEFEAVLNLCKYQYKKVQEIVERRARFLEDTKSKFAAAEESMPDDAVRKGLEKLVTALIAKADAELLGHAKHEIEGIREITEFLMRFTPSDTYQHLDLSFLNDLKEKKNGTV